ncbi:MAG: phosphotransferase [Steroidobacteraceae bacterium]
MRLPVKLEQVTSAWLTEALRVHYPGVHVTEGRVEDVIYGTSTKIRVRCEYNREGREAALPATVIVKGGFEPHSPSMKEMYANEARFYRDVQPFVSIHSPRCYYAGIDPGSHQSIVVMEDLTAKGVEFLHAQRPQRYSEVARRLTDMARYHAQTWNSPELKPGGRFDWIGSRFSGWSLEYQERYFVPDVWQQYVSSPRGAAVSQRLHDRAAIRRALQRIGEIEATEPVCLIHGDTHLGNLYIESDGTPGFFDAQVARAPWHLEVSYHLTCALDIPDREAWEQALLVHYLEALQANGIEAPSYESAWLSYRRSLAYGYFIFLINETRFQTEAVNTACAARFGAAMLDHGTLDLLR